MPILPIHLIEHPVLRSKTEWIESVNHEIHQLVQDMIVTMNNADGIGLAAPQVGHSVRLFVVDISSFLEEFPQDQRASYPEQPMIFINPEIVGRSDDYDEFEEGCLSIPHIREPVERPASIQIKFQDLTFKQHTMAFDGLLARVIQHEYDHLEGFLFIDLISPWRRTILKYDLSEIAHNKVDVPYPVLSAK